MKASISKVHVIPSAGPTSTGTVRVVSSTRAVRFVTLERELSSEFGFKGRDGSDEF